MGNAATSKKGDAAENGRKEEEEEEEEEDASEMAWQSVAADGLAKLTRRTRHMLLLLLLPSPAEGVLLLTPGILWIKDS